MSTTFSKNGSAALMHAIMIGSNEGDQVMIAAATPALLKRAFADLVGGKLKNEDISHVAVCEAELAGLLQFQGADHG
ncbi:hypothetical protein [Massilia sp. YIM B02443]|uniref:hypothetical protein n=1 Tax=Massilia sp. YIM B02443 TaxID=3050127 RepID=UPI0025B67688|nr:hypothetical protein [Massilia sp. YIM B02443]MDN4038684.1 hypothetical protein [Massilia sp. YIM B02443]